MNGVRTTTPNDVRTKAKKMNDFNNGSGRDSRIRNSGNPLNSLARVRGRRWFQRLRATLAPVRAAVTAALAGVRTDGGAPGRGETKK